MDEQPKIVGSVWDWLLKRTSGSFQLYSDNRTDEVTEDDEVISVFVAKANFVEESLQSSREAIARSFDYSTYYRDRILVHGK